jgi:hypothetical protein
VSLADALEFRTTFGFTTDMDAVVASLQDPNADTTWGTPLTAEEARNMAERQRFQELTQPLEAFIAKRPESFGGFYYDQTTGELAGKHRHYVEDVGR